MYSPIQTDLVVAVRDQGYMFVTGPDVIKDVTGEDVTLDELGGADYQARYGNIHQVVGTRRPRSSTSATTWTSCRPTPSTTRRGQSRPGAGDHPHDLELDSIVPDNDNAAYDMHEILLRIFDDGDFLDVAAQSGQAIITGYARVDGRTVAVIANQPMYNAGAIDNEESDKAARFVRFNDSFNIPLVFVVDTRASCPASSRRRTASSSVAAGSSTRWSRRTCRR